MKSYLPIAVLAILLPASAGAVRVERIYGVLANNKPVEVAAGEAYVRFSPNVSVASHGAALGSIGAKSMGEEGIGWTRVSLPMGMTVAQGLKALAQIPGVLQVEPNHVYRALKSTSDPMTSNQYHLGIVNAYSAWDFEDGTTNPPIIAIMDSGIEMTHPDLRSRVKPNLSAFCDPGVPPTEVATVCTQNASTSTIACEHGTEVSGVAAAATNNGIGVAGMTWGGQLVSLKVFNDADCNFDCSDADPVHQIACGTTDHAIAAAINYTVTTLAPLGRVVVNMSLGDALPCSNFLGPVIQDAVFNHNIVVIAAAGNDGAAVETPGNCPGVIPVGATDSSDNITYFSSRGPELAASGVVAPGYNMTTTAPNGGYTGSASGTSFSSPIVAGIAGLILSAKPAFTSVEVSSAIRSSAQSLGQPANVQGAGRVNAFLALRFTERGTLADFKGEQTPIAFPDPFRPAQNGNVTITVPPGMAGTGTSVKIYTMAGQLVKDLGAQTSWDGKNGSGTLVASGVYMFRLKTSQGERVGKFAVIR